MNREAIFKFQPFSKKQMKILTWWMPGSPVHTKQGIIADGAIRSGKTLSMSLSFVIWAMEDFNGMNFALCGKSIGSLRRNVIMTLKQMLKSRGYHVEDRRADNRLVVKRGNTSNDFYLFGGKDESSQDLIQGITLAGVFFDEVALMPESFVNQATGRCSVTGSKFWFNCNPANPMHWFKVNWIDAIKHEDVEKRKDLVYLHFMMDDNLSLSEEIKQRYRSMYSGVFYKRYILGEWRSADGLIYDMFTDENIVTDQEVPIGMVNHPVTRRYISIDVGISNATVFLDIYYDGHTAWVLNEYYHSGKEKGRQKTVKEYVDDLAAFGGNEVVCNIIDPSGLPFKVEMKTRNMRVKDADNEVLNGIMVTAMMIGNGKIKIHKRCKRLIGELQGYVWDEKALQRGEEKPIQINDHACLIGDTLIDTTCGQKRICDLVGITGQVYCFDERKKKKTSAGYKNVHLTEKNAVIYQIELEDGKTIKATGNHPVLTDKGWITVEQLSEQDLIVRIDV